MAGFLLMDVDWQATGSRSELWDRRQVCSKNRMGAQASSRAREELRPCGHLCLYRSGLGVFGEIQVAFADNKAGEHRRVCFRLRAVDIIPKLVMRLRVLEIASLTLAPVLRASVSRAATLDFL
jgi:hypothetical protein